MSDEWRVTIRPAEIEPEYTSDPTTILALPKDQRLDAMADIFRQLSAQYARAAQRKDSKNAKEAAAAAIILLGGMYPERNDEGHKLIFGILSALVDARSGSYRHILLRPGSRVTGTKRGLGNTAIAAGAVAAVWTLESRGMSKRAARLRVAAMLTAQGYSRRTDDHGQPLPVTDSALRTWEERPHSYPVVESTAPAYREHLENRIESEGLTTAEQVATFLESLVPEFLANHIAL